MGHESSAVLAHLPVASEMEELVRRQLELLGQDPDREGLARTPERVASRSSG